MSTISKEIMTYRFVWGGLLLLTFIAYLFLDNEAGLDGLAKTVVLGMVAAVKALLVAHFFMEINHASVKARVLIYSWIAVLAFLIVLMPAIGDFIPYVH